MSILEEAQRLSDQFMNISDAVVHVESIQENNRQNWNSVPGIRTYEETCIFRHWDKVIRVLLKEENIETEEEISETE